MLLATALALHLLQDVPTDVYCSKQTGSSSTMDPSPIISSFLELVKENCRCSKICGGAENIVKTETQQHCKWIARFYYFRHLYSAGSVLCIIQPL